MMRKHTAPMTVVYEDMAFEIERAGVGLTAFERDVLKATLTIPFGETRSYKWVAEKIGRPKAVRAVGQALRKNPWPLLIPCHRVIQSDGGIGGYAGGPGDRKKALIALERDICRAWIS